MSVDVSTIRDLAISLEHGGHVTPSRLRAVAASFADAGDDVSVHDQLETLATIMEQGGTVRPIDLRQVASSIDK